MNANSDDSDSGDERRNSVELDVNRDQPRSAGILHRSFKPTFIVCISVNLMSMCADPGPQASWRHRTRKNASPEDDIPLQAGMS